jgi:serine/threonine protein kinase
MATQRIGTQLSGPGGELYRIEEYRGGGSFGEVYKAVGVTSGAIVAVKMVPQHKLSAPPTLSFRSVLNEGRAEMMKVNHPNVARVLHVNTGATSEVGPYVIMEFVDGKTLKDVLDQRRNSSQPFTLDEALLLMRGITLGAQAISEHLIHRDIKPDNILIDGPADMPRPRIADFGLAKVATEHTRPETFKGIQALLYMSPEVWRDEKNTIKIDVYSVGLVFYEILTLEHPFLPLVAGATNVLAKLREVHLTVQCPDVRVSRPEVPLSIAKLLSRMTDKSPGNRPSWDEVLVGLTNPAQPVKPPAAVDPSILAALKHQANERFREEQSRAAAELSRQREFEREKARGDEYAQSAMRLLTQFDQIIEALNDQESNYPIKVDGSKALSRNYTLPNNRRLVCHIFGAKRGSKAGGSGILGAGYLGVEGGLSANLALFGQPDNIAAASWSAIEVTVFALFNGPARLRTYQEARIPESTIRYAEFFDSGEPWRRDSPSHFGIPDADVFYEHYERGHRATHSLSFSTRPDPVQMFKDILLMGLKMPKRDQ